MFPKPLVTLLLLVLALIGASVVIGPWVALDAAVFLGLRSSSSWTDPKTWFLVMLSVASLQLVVGWLVVLRHCLEKTSSFLITGRIRVAIVICQRCGPLSASEFYRHHRRGYQSLCKKCKSSYNKQYYLTNRSVYAARVRTRKETVRAYIRSIRLKCATKGCGENHPATLDFHHKDPTVKEAVVSKMITNGWSIKRVQAELKKCTVLCSNCHRKLHWRMRKQFAVLSA